MSQEANITGSFIWTFDDVKSRQDALAPIGSQQRRFLFFFLIMVVGVITMIKDIRKVFFSSDPLIVAAPLIAMLGIYLAVMYNRNANLKTGFLQSPDSNKRIEVTFTRDEIVMKAEGIYEHKWKWSVIKEVQQNPKGFCFFLAEQAGFWIPIRAFQSQEDVNSIAQLARRFTPKFKVLP